jgi:hypothetical protein
MCFSFQGRLRRQQLDQLLEHAQITMSVNFRHKIGELIRVDTVRSWSGAADKRRGVTDNSLQSSSHAADRLTRRRFIRHVAGSRIRKWVWIGVGFADPLPPDTNDVLYSTRTLALCELGKALVIL